MGVWDGLLAAVFWISCTHKNTPCFFTFLPDTYAFSLFAQSSGDGTLSEFDHIAITAVHAFLQVIRYLLPAFCEKIAEIYVVSKYTPPEIPIFLYFPFHIFAIIWPAFASITHRTCTSTLRRTSRSTEDTCWWKLCSFPDWCCLIWTGMILLSLRVHIFVDILRHYRHLARHFLPFLLYCRCIWPMGVCLQLTTTFLHFLAITCTLHRAYHYALIINISPILDVWSTRRFWTLVRRHIPTCLKATVWPRWRYTTHN